MRRLFLVSFLFCVLFGHHRLFGDSRNDANAKKPEASPDLTEIHIDILMPTIDRQGADSGIVLNAVSVLSGHLTFQEKDLILSGPQPKSLSRSYSSGNEQWLTLHTGWNIDQLSWCHLRRKGESKTFKGFSLKNKIFYYSEGGGVTQTESRHVEEGTKQYQLTHGKNSFLGWCLPTILEGGKIHRKNLTYKINDPSELSYKSLEITDGAGTVRSFRSHTSFRYQEKQYTKVNEHLILPIETIRYPSGFQTSFHHDRKNGKLAIYDHTSPGFSRIVYRGTKGKEFASFTFVPLYDRKNKKLPRVLEVQGSKGRKMAYHFSPHDPKKEENDFFYLDKVEAFSKEQEKAYFTRQYEYEDVLGCKSKKLTRKVDPLGRYLNVRYYQKGDQHWGRELKEKSPTIGKVASLVAPAGPKNQKRVLCSFKYDSKASSDNRFIEGRTIAHFANDREVEYLYKKNRLVQVKETGSSPYRAKLFEWTPDDHMTPGVLLSKMTIACAGSKVLFGNSYSYDSQGNLVEEKITGDLTGSGETVNFCKQYVYTSNGRAKNLLSKVITPRTTTTLTYMGNADLIQSIIQSGDSFQRRQFYEYDEDHILVLKIQDDGSGKELNNLEDVSFRKITEIQPINGLPGEVLEKYWDPHTGNEEPFTRTTFTYNEDGKQTEKRAFSYEEGAWCFKQSWKWEYDVAGRCIREIDPLHHEKEYSYDVLGNLIVEKTDDRTLRHQYNQMNRNIETSHEGPNTPFLSEKWTYDVLGKQTSHTDLYGRKTRFFYDPFGRLIKKEFPLITQEDGKGESHEETYGYNVLDQMIEKLDANGSKTVMTYTAQGNVSSTIFPDQTKETKSYTLDGLLEKETYPDGEEVEYVYDAFGRLVKETRSKEGDVLSTNTYTYNAHFLISMTENGLRTTHYHYNRQGQLEEECVGTHRIQYFYDSLGRKTRTRTYADEHRYVEKCEEFDLLDRPIRRFESDEEGHRFHEEQLEYDSHGQMIRKISFVPGDQAATTYSYDGLGRRISTIDPNGKETRTSYSVEDRKLQTTTTHPDCTFTVETKDQRDRLISVEVFSKDGEILQSRRCYYDAVGNLKKERFFVFDSGVFQRTVENGFSYDSMGRLTEQREACGTCEEKVTRFEYDSRGRKTALHKPDQVSLYYSYNKKGLLTLEWDTRQTIFYRYTYDSLNNFCSIKNSFTDKETLRIHDIHGQIIEEWLENGGHIRRCFDGIGRPIHLIFDDRSRVSYEYSGSKLTAVIRKDESGFELYRHEYLYDSMGRLEEEHLPFLGGEVQHKYNLTSQWMGTTHPHLTMETSGYDEVYNLLDFSTKSGIDEEQTSYAYDNLHQLTREDGKFSHQYRYDSLYNRVNKDGIPYEVNSLNQIYKQDETIYQYDPNGNLTLLCSPERILILSYDTLDRLISVQQGDKKTCYEYDGSNRRTVKTLQEKQDGEWKNVQTTFFLYDGKKEIGSFDSKWIDTLRILGLGLGAEVGAAVAIEKNGSVFLPVHSPFGHLILLLNTNGQPLQHIRSTAYGESYLFDDRGTPLDLSESISPWILSSKRYDQETGFTFYGRRYYSPEIGRWITPDPTYFEDGPNLYSYVKNNPLSYTDLEGLWALDFAKGLAVGTGDIIAIKAAIWAAGVIYPPAGVIASVAFQAYSAYSLASTVYTAGDYLATKAIQEGVVSGTTSVCKDIATTVTNITPRAGGEIVSGFLAPKGINQAKLRVADKIQRSSNYVGTLAKTSRVGTQFFSRTQSQRTLASPVWGWKVGDPINHRTAQGKIPSWSAVRQRYWKNEALLNPGKYKSDQLTRMQKGLAPQVFNINTGTLESLELHHFPEQRNGGLFDVIALTSSDHSRIDMHRRL